MRFVTPTQTVNRNLKIGKYAFNGGMIMLLVAFGVNLYALGQPENPTLVLYAFGTFILGFTLTNIGTVLNNNWGRRPDRGLADALKGLDDRYTLYNYRLGASHVLVGPQGVTVFVPRYQLGLVAYNRDKKRWEHPSAPRGFFNLFARDPLGNPALDAEAEIERLNRWLKKHLPGTEAAPQSVIVFMSPRAELEASGSPVPALHVKQLKEYVRRQPKAPGLPPAALDEQLGITADSLAE